MPVVPPHPSSPLGLAGVSRACSNLSVALSLLGKPPQLAQAPRSAPPGGGGGADCAS